MTKPMASMTGFARTDGLEGGLAWAWELRSVNGRGLDLRLRLPPGLDQLEPHLREATAQALRRGSVTIGLSVRREQRGGEQRGGEQRAGEQRAGEQGGRLVADQAALDQVLALALALAERIPGAGPPRPEALLALPGVLRAASPELAEPQLAALRRSFDAALAQLVAARQGEGAGLRTLLSAQLDEVAALHAQAQALAATQPAAQRARMLESLHALLREAAGTPTLPGEDRIAQEVALLAARSDVREELDRLALHVAAARALLAEGAQVGRRLDFLVQEFVRETNTLCAKSALPGLTTLGLQLKATLEQLREQVQNVE